MGTTVDILMFVGGGYDSLNALGNGAQGGVIGAVGQVFGVAAAGAQAVASVVGGTNLTGVISSTLGTAGGALSAIQVTLDVIDGQQVNRPLKYLSTPRQPQARIATSSNKR